MISKIDEDNNIFACFITLARQWDVTLCTWVRVCLHFLPRQVLNHFHKILLHNQAQKSISRSLTENPGFNHCSNVSEKVPFLSLLMPLFLLLPPVSIILWIFPLHVLLRPFEPGPDEGHICTWGQGKGLWTGKKWAMEEGIGVEERLYGGRVGSGSQAKSSGEMRSQSVNSHCEPGAQKSFKHMRTSGSFPINSGTVAGCEGAQTGPVVEGEAKIIASHTLWNQQVLKRIHRRPGRTLPALFFSRLL